MTRTRGEVFLIFAAIYLVKGDVDESTCSRQGFGGRKYAGQTFGIQEHLNQDDMISILRGHESGICMHGSF